MSQFESQFEENLYQLRRDKLAQIAALVRAQDPALSEQEAMFPNSFAFTHTVPMLRAIGDVKSAEELEADRIEAAVAGRIMAIRVQGKAGFAQLQQGGQRLQLYVRKDDVGEDMFALYRLLDLGDHIGVRGSLMRTRTGELTLKAHSISLPEQAGKPAIAFLTKAMLALPDKYHGLEDVELRYRQRYVDLIMNSGTLTKAEAPAPSSNPVILSGAQSEESKDPEAAGKTGAAALLSADVPGVSAVTDTAASNGQHNDAPLNVREVFVKRAAVLRAIRKFFDARGYLEVETPMLHTVAGGAAARPFTTHHNALDIPLSLRIAPELYLKRLVVGGLDRVYEINRNFRNEGVSTKHNPEFTMLEFYQAYANYHDLMDLTEELIKSVATEVNGSTLTNFNGVEIDLGKWRRLSMQDAIIEFWPPEAGSPPAIEIFVSFDDLNLFLSGVIGPMGSNVQTLQESRRRNDLWRVLAGLRQTDDSLSSARFLAFHARDEGREPAIREQALGKAIASLFEAVAEPHLIQPTIIYDFPLAVSPLSKVKPDEPDWVERFEFYIGGFEVGNAFSELNDPDDQRRRFEAQVADKDPEAMAEVDEDYVRALGYGLPPTAGEGIGIDRLTMLLTGSRSIRDVILFPLMRPQTKPVEAMEAEHEAGESSE